MPSSPRARTVAVFVLLAASSTALAQSCYYPDGSLPTDFEYVPCTGESVSSCCIPSEGDVCLASGLCYYKTGNYPFRGACTDKSWGSSKCPQYCMNQRRGGWYAMVKCTNSKYCCSQSTSNLACCNDASLTFSIDITNVVNNYLSKSSLAATPTISPRVSDTSVLSATPIISPRVSDTSVAATATTGDAIGYSTTASRSAAAATTTTTAVPSPGPVRQSNSKTMIIAIAIAVPVVLIVLALVVWGCLERRKRKRTNVQAPTMKPPFTQMPPQQGMQENYMQPGLYGGQQQNYPPQPMSPMMKGSGHAAASPPAYTEGGGYMKNIPPQPPQPPAVPELGGQSSTSAPTQKRGVPVYEVAG